MPSTSKPCGTHSKPLVNGLAYARVLALVLADDHQLQCRGSRADCGSTVWLVQVRILCLPHHLDAAPMDPAGDITNFFHRFGADRLHPQLVHHASDCCFNKIRCLVNCGFPSGCDNIRWVTGWYESQLRIRKLDLHLFFRTAKYIYILLPINGEHLGVMSSPPFPAAASDSLI